jgi:hypothetical protein
MAAKKKKEKMIAGMRKLEEFCVSVIADSIETFPYRSAKQRFVNRYWMDRLPERFKPIVQHRRKYVGVGEESEAMSFFDLTRPFHRVTIVTHTPRSFPPNFERVNMKVAIKGSLWERS